MSTLTTVRAAGAVAWRSGPTGRQIAVVHRPKYDDWTLPKGKPVDGESLFETAVREVHEETGVSGPLGPYLGELRYRRVQDGVEIEKAVSYWAMSVEAEAFTVNSEVDELRWLAPADACEQLSHDHDCGPVEKFAATPIIHSTVLLVRHGRAGDRETWTGDDRLRPLDRAGRAQAQAVAAAAPLFGAGRVFAADLVRCTETVRPLAERLGVAVEADDAFAEEHYDRDRALHRLLEIAAWGGTSVVCSQGGAIPDLVRSVADHGGVPLASTPSRKGSCWALFFGRDHRLVAADYYADLAAPV